MAAMRDFKDLFIVDKISGVDPNNITRGPLSALKFKVAWKGYPNQDTWEGWKQLRNLEQFREFLEKTPRNHTEACLNAWINRRNRTRTMNQNPGYQR
jgi:hypothetical protein